MKIAVASGKGGTGKTSLAVSLSRILSGTISLLDCDVEEPNCHLFFNQEKCNSQVIEVPVPVIDQNSCNGCGKCADLCQFNAIISLGGTKALVFHDLCHSCGGCSLICPESAISEKAQNIGNIQKTQISDSKTLYTGQLKIGRALAPPVIREVLKRIKDNEDYVIIDAPPGTSCSFVTTVKAADFTIFITEATPFGLHDLSLAVDTIKQLKVPFGVIVNRIQNPDNSVSDYCKKENIPLLMQIRESRKIAEYYSRGISMDQAEPDIIPGFSKSISIIESILEKGV